MTRRVTKVVVDDSSGIWIQWILCGQSKAWMVPWDNESKNRWRNGDFPLRIKISGGGDPRQESLGPARLKAVDEQQSGVDAPFRAPFQSTRMRGRARL